MQPHHHHFAGGARSRHHPQPPPPPPIADPNYHRHRSDQNASFVSNYAQHHPRVSNSAPFDGPFDPDPWIDRRDPWPPRNRFDDSRFLDNPRVDFAGEGRAHWHRNSEFQNRPAGLDRRSFERWGGDRGFSESSSRNSYPDIGTVSRDFAGYDRGGDEGFLFDRRPPHLYSDRYRDDLRFNDSGREAGFDVEQRIMPPVTPMMRSDDRSFVDRDRELFKRDADVPCDVENIGRDNRFEEELVKRITAKRRMDSESNEFNLQHSVVRPPAKRSALSRIQSGVSVWNRIEQKQTYVYSSAPISTNKSISEQQSKVDSVDLSFSDTSVAKIMSPSSPGMPSSNGKAPDVAMSGNNSKAKRKYIKKQERLVSVITDSLLTVKKDEDDGNRETSSTSHEILSNSGELEVPLASNNPSNLPSPQQSSKINTSTSTSTIHIDKEEKTPNSIIGKEKEEQKSSAALYTEVDVGLDSNSQDADASRKTSSTSHEILSNSGELEVPLASTNPSNLPSSQPFSKINTSTSTTTIHIDKEEKTPNSIIDKEKEEQKSTAATYTEVDAGLDSNSQDADATRKTSSTSHEILGNSGELEVSLASTNPSNHPRPQPISKINTTTSTSTIHIDEEEKNPNSIINKEKEEQKSSAAAYTEVDVGLDSNSQDADASRETSSTSHGILSNSGELEVPIASFKPSYFHNPYSKMIASTVNIETGERSTKSFITKEGEEEQKFFTSTYSEVEVGSDTSSKDYVQQYTFPETLVEACLAPHPSTSNLICDSNINDDYMNEDKSKLEKNDVQDDINSFPDTADTENVNFQTYPEEKHKVSLYVDSANELPSCDVLQYNNSDQVQSNIARHMGNGENSEYFCQTLASPTLSVVASDNQGTTPVVLCHSDAICDNSVICENIEDKIQQDSKQQVLSNTASTALVAIDSGETEAFDATSVLGTKGAPLAAEVEDRNLDQHVLGKTMDGTQDDLSLNIVDGLKLSASLRQNEENSSSFLASESFNCMPNVDTLIVVADVKEMIHHTEALPCLDDLVGTGSCIDNNVRDHKKRRIGSKETSSLTMRDPLGYEEFIKLDTTILHDKHMLEETYMLQSLEPKKNITTNSNAIDGIACFKPKTLQNSDVPKVLPSQTNLVGSLQGLSRSASNARNRTWHRKSSLPSITFSNGVLQNTKSAPSSKQSPKKPGKLQTSYVRKGNSLTSISLSDGVLQNTKSAPSSKQSPKKSGKLQTSYVRKGNSLIRKNATDLPQPSHVTFAPSKPNKHATPASIELVTKGELSNSLASSNHTIEGLKTPPLPLGLNSVSPVSNSPTHSVLALSETPIADGGTSIPAKADGFSFHKSNNQSAMITQVSEPSQSKRMMYVKRKSNQLVATAQPRPNNLPNQYVEKIQASSFVSSDVYFRRQKNQLIRDASPSDNLQKQDSVPADDRNSEIKKVPSAVRKNRNLSNSIKKRLSKVWLKANKNTTLSNVWTLSGDGENTKALDYRKVLPFIPWKRTIYWARTSSVLKKYSTSLTCQKLYQQKVGAGCSLKWSRSTGRRSKRVNTDNESLTTTMTAKPDVKDRSYNTQTSLVPKRLQIGQREYIRIGNGNKLVRNPKKIARILANEKVRWSLHTARMRLARKQQYCQFFTRFGQCNKKGGKCPYIHDPAKVAICTKFLRGSCSNTSCKLTHEIIPERMPDCSYFLQGLCTNTSCPYRHVNVNPNAAVCEGFLKGYCADGDECPKKHKYVCPVFEATGKCPKGSKCKLHHPKLKSKFRHRNRLMVQQNSWGRYFGSSITEFTEPLLAYSDGQALETVVEDHLSSSPSHFSEYVQLDLGDRNSMVVDVAMDSHPIYLDSDESDMEDDNLDALIKPIRIMKMNSTITPSTDV